MTVRNLCYKHHTQEFDKLANHDRHLAADWRTVEPCEMCAEVTANLLAALEETLHQLCDCCRRLNPQHADCTSCQGTEQARAAVAGARGGG